VDAVHGFGHPWQAPLFPHSIGIGATWDPSVAKAGGAATGKAVQATGWNWVFAPVQDLARDNRWGRTYETWAEQPVLASALGAANVKGLQIRARGQSLGTAATVKHFAGYSQSINGHDRNQALLPLSYLQSIILPAYDFLASSLFSDQVKTMRLVAQDTSPHLVIFTSPRAVLYGLGQIPDELLKQARIGAMGPTTASLLDATGLVVSLQSDKAYSTETLLGTLQLENGVSAKPRHAFIVAAPGGRSRLKDGLLAMGYVVHMLMVYERRSAELPAEAVAEIEQANSLLSVWTSANTMNALSQRLPTHAWSRLCHGEWLVISERLRRLARAFRPTRIHLSSGPTNADLLNAISEMG